MYLHGRDWKKVEQHIGTRSGAQIRSHAQKFFSRVEKELGADVETYIQQKAKALIAKKNIQIENTDNPSVTNQQSRKESVGHDS